MFRSARPTTALPTVAGGDPFARALVIRFGRVGDMLVLTPALRALRLAAPGARIEVLTTRTGATTLATNPHTDTIHVLDWRRVPAPLNPERARLVRRLRARGFDALFLMETAERYRSLARAVRAARTFTFARAGEPADAGHARRTGKHEARHFEDVLALAGVPADGVHYDYPIGEAARARAAALLNAAGVDQSVPLLGVHAGQFKRRRRRRAPHAKAWPTERYIDVIRRVVGSSGARAVLTGSAAERELNTRIAAALAPGMAIDLAGRTDLETLAAVIDRCTLFISPDTGPAHLAAAVDTPVVALFGPTPPGNMGPLGDESRIQRLYAEPSAEPDAARGNHHPRMWAVTVEDVLAAVGRLGVTLER